VVSVPKTISRIRISFYLRLSLARTPRAINVAGVEAGGLGVENNLTHRG